MPQTKILVVEDEGLIALNLSQALNRGGYDVVGIASSGEEALETLSRVTPDLVLMDIRLDGQMDGIEAATKVQSDFQLPVIFLTAHSDPDTLIRAKMIDPFGYIRKPFGNSDLSIPIEMAIHKHSMEKLLKQRLAQLADIFLSSPDATIVTDTEGIVQFMNAEAGRTLKCAESGWRGRRFHELMPLFEPISGIEADDFVGQMLKNEMPLRDEIFTFPRELCFRDPDGVEIIIEGEVALGLMPNQCDEVGAIITFRDVSRPRGQFVPK
jgi:CheY-like chemotaxis protein